MMVGLFRKILRTAQSGAACMCQPSAAKPDRSPFEEVMRLAGPYEHESVSLARCDICGRAALYYSADVYDDFWQHWCTIDEVERTQLLEEYDPDDPQRPVRARAMLARHAYLVRHPVRDLEWVPPGYPVVEGPPW
jgi:hypothetical protein